MQKFILNIGLQTRGHVAHIEAAEVFEKMSKAGIPAIRAAQHQSDSELTLVVEVKTHVGVTHAQIALLSRDLGQDCIAVWSPFTNRGALIGPRASEWGAFDPKQFFLIDGTRLQDQQDDKLLADLGVGVTPASQVAAPVLRALEASIAHGAAYQGHLDDGSSVQKHSAGPLYPCVIYAQETPRGLQWGVISPRHQEGVLVGAHAAAVAYAELANQLRTA
jgi:hypothetical protein